MDAELDARKSARENLNFAYSHLRTLKEKRAGLQKALEITKKELEGAKKEKGTDVKPVFGIQINSKNKKKKSSWHSKYNSFFTSGGKICAAGSNANENDELYSKHLSTTDLFFHADIQGAPAVILKGGQSATNEELKEAAQWGASFSSAWKVGAASVDVYAVKPGQVSKNAQGGYVGRGAFAIEGERIWFYTTQLKLKIGVLDGQIKVLPAVHSTRLQKENFLTPGQMEKTDACNKLSSLFGAKADEIASLLPSGKFAISQ